MKKLIIYLVIPFFALTLSNCKKDCNGSFTIEGTLWNGTKNQPHTNTKIEITAGGKSSLYTGALNAKDLGTVYTNNLGKFTFTYNCIDEDDWDIVLKPGTVQATPFLKVPINQNYSQFYNIPDSVSLELFIKQTKGLEPSDTLYVTIGVPDMIEKLIFTKQDVPNGFYKRIRIAYSLAISLRSSLTIFYAIGYQNYLQAYKTDWSSQNSNNIAKLEPEINSYTISY